MLKKIIGIGLLLVLILSLSACNANLNPEINDLRRRVTDLETNSRILDEKIRALEEENKKLREKLDGLEEKGDGTEANPYIIQTAYQLKIFAYEVNDGENYAYTYFALGADIDLGGKEWTPIGKDFDCPFEGSFDGEGYKITNFKITIAAPYSALFGYNKGIIKNLGTENFAVDINSEIDGFIYAGGLVGLNDATGALINCYANGNVEINTPDYAFYYTYPRIYAGGLAGYNGGTIFDCHAKGDVSAYIKEPFLYWLDDDYSAAVQYNTYNQTTIYATKPSEPSPPSRDIFAGGLAGENSGIINTCYATGNITAINDYQSYSNAYVGGLIGYNAIYNENSTITNCYATGDVTAINYYQSYSNAYVGGLIGYDAIYNENSTITNCYATGNVSTDSSYYACAGGLIGENRSTITNCYATGNINTTAYGVASAGGLIGRNYYSETTNCYATGDVTAGSYYDAYAGGLAGRNYYSTITNCYATGDVSATVFYSDSSDFYDSYAYAGGLIGLNETTEAIANCYRFDGQNFYRKDNVGEYNTPNNTIGEPVSIDRLNDAAFYTEDLDWDDTIWDFTYLNFEGGKYPKLRVFLTELLD